MFQMHRIFCATPWELEAERHRFYELIGHFNENSAMPKGVLYVPVTLPNVFDKRPLQYEIDRNIRNCRYYILLLSDDWGPAERNFKNEYALVLRCIDDPSSPMESVAILGKRQPSGQPQAWHLMENGLMEPQAMFSTLAEFDECVNALLAGWLERLPAGENDQRKSAA